jgi:hypothetical protein
VKNGDENVFPTGRDLLNEKSWLTASDLKGLWSPAGTLPQSFNNIPNTANWQEVRNNLPGQPIQESEVPQIFVRKPRRN